MEFGQAFAQTHLMIGASRLNLRTLNDEDGTPPRTDGARMFYTRLGDSEKSPVASMHLATAEESEHGSGALLDLVSDDADWWEKVAAEAAATAKALRELKAKSTT